MYLLNQKPMKYYTYIQLYVYIYICTYVHASQESKLSICGCQHYEQLVESKTRRGGAGKDGTPTDLSAQETTGPLALQGIEGSCPERFFRKHNGGTP